MTQDKNKAFPGHVSSNEVYDIGKDTDGKSNTTKELHEVILSIILEFDRVCRLNNIPYALAFGSALGLHNYAGFIPWDDDADIAVMYEDIPRLLAALKKDLDPNFSFHSWGVNKRFNVLIPTLKIMREDTYLHEVNDWTLPNKYKKYPGVFVDVCAFMGVPEDEAEHKKVIAWTKRKVAWYVFVDGMLRLNPWGLKKKIKQYEKDMAEKYRDSPVISQSVIIPWQDFGSMVHKNAFPRDVILPFREYTFMGHQLFSFNDVETFARMRYGDAALRTFDGEKWVDNYPEQKRKARHFLRYNLAHPHPKKKK